MKVYVTRKLSGPSLEQLKAQCEVIINEVDSIPDFDTLLKGIKDKDGIITLLTDFITKPLIDAATDLKIIANCAAGYDNIDIEYATKRNIMVTNTPGVLTFATAELTWALILATARRIPEADHFTRNGRFKGWSPTLFLGTELYGKTLGIVGAGKIGAEIGLKAKAFGMSVLYSDLNRNVILEKTVQAKQVPLSDLLERADFVSLHVPLNEKTYHLISEKELRLMRPTAFLINTSRGKVVDEGALIQALREERLRGAGLDVYENEPEISTILKELPNVVLLPHMGSATQTTRERMANIAVKNLLIGLQGEIPPNLVNKEVI